MNEQPTNSADANFSASGSSVDQREVSQPKPLNREKVIQTFNALLTDVSIPASLRDTTEDLLDGLGAMDPLQLTEAWLKANPVTAELANANRKLEVTPDGSLQIVGLEAPAEAAAAPAEPIVAPSTPPGIRIEPGSVATLPTDNASAAKTETALPLPDDKTAIIRVQPNGAVTAEPIAAKPPATEPATIDTTPKPADAPMVEPAKVDAPKPVTVEAVPAAAAVPPTTVVEGPTPPPTSDEQSKVVDKEKQTAQLRKDLEAAQDLDSLIATLETMKKEQITFDVPAASDARSPEGVLAAINGLREILQQTKDAKPVESTSLLTMYDRQLRRTVTTYHSLQTNVDRFFAGQFPVLKALRDNQAKEAKPAEADNRPAEEIAREIDLMIFQGQTDKAKELLEQNAQKLASTYSETNQQIEKLRIAQSVLITQLRTASLPDLAKTIIDFQSVFPKASVSFMDPGEKLEQRRLNTIPADKLAVILTFNSQVEAFVAKNQRKEPGEAAETYNFWAWYDIGNSIVQQFTTSFDLRFRLIADALVRLNQDEKWKQTVPTAMKPDHVERIQKAIDKLRGKVEPAVSPDSSTVFGTFRERLTEILDPSVWGSIFKKPTGDDKK